MRRTNFSQSLELGLIGENIVKRFLERNGYVVYRPETKGRSHCFDMLVTLNKESIFALDVKTKKRLNKWPATGVDQKSFEQYRNFENVCSIPFYLVFVDAMEMSVYGQSISVLEQGYKDVDGKIYPANIGQGNTDIRIWHLDQMNHITDLGVDDAGEIICLEQRSSQYG